MDDRSTKMGRWQGAGLMATTLLGTGVFILPQMTIDIAGYGAVYTWLLLTLTIIPVTVVFGALTAKFPHAAGPAYFVEQAFGQVAGRSIGLLFLFVVPIGAPAAILLTFHFVYALTPLSEQGLLAAELGSLLLLFALNYKGIQISAKLQFLLTLAIIIVVIALFLIIQLGLTTGESALQTFSTVLPQEKIQPNLIMTAAGLAFWSFLGVEAMSHLANDFRNPKKDMLPAMMIGTVLVGSIYFLCTWVLLRMPMPTDIVASNLPSSNLAMINAFNYGFGGLGEQVIGILGIAGGLATVNVYTASLSRLAWSFSKDGVLPRYLSPLNQHNVPSRALAAILIVMGLVIVLAYVANRELEDLIAWVNGVFVVIYFASMMAAAKLLPKHYQPLIFLGCLFCALLAYGLGLKMVYALLLLSLTLPFLKWQQTHLARE
ncbi:L-methionine/branched-chain amino acid transporter [Photobacterium indicum]|uniref:L-methionine/branched-chain amino acid transporter n=1 Tax=Photobacterium indicum TaxID=81447 RepID=A0A2T3LA23_9GAMM|nr:L-methionine/branched-chain amino acid transporter [Photobacterium indicum]PSV48162.1 L-methionine/branched-chain amino acid transporter [Photobacterium indicum]